MAQSEGLFASVRALTTTLLYILQTRLELLATEMEEDRAQMIKLVCLAGFMFFFICLGAVLLTVLVIVAYWDSDRVLAIGAMAFIYLAVAAILALYLSRCIRYKPKLFSASLAELGKDRAALESSN